MRSPGAALPLLLLAATACNANPLLREGQSLAVGDCLHSASGLVHACLEKNGALVVATGADAAKAESVLFTGGAQKGKKGKYSARMADGSLAVFLEGKKGDTAVWSTETAGGNYAFLDDSGSLTVYQSGLIWDSALWSSTPAVAVAAAADTVVEPATGIALPAVEAFGGGAPLRCVGAGVRAKSLTVISVNVYALGLYVDARGAAKALARYAGVAPAALANDQGFYDELMKPAAAFSRYLLLSFARDVSAAKVADALTSVTGVAADVLSSFSALLNGAIGPSVHAGDTIALGWEGKDRLVVLVRGGRAGEVRDAALAPAIFQLYLGKNPVSPPAKEAFASGIAALL